MSMISKNLDEVHPEEWPFGTCFHHGRRWSSASLNHFHCGWDGANADRDLKESFNHFHWRRKGANAEEDTLFHKINRDLARLQFFVLLVTFFGQSYFHWHFLDSTGNCSCCSCQSQTRQNDKGGGEWGPASYCRFEIGKESIWIEYSLQADRKTNKQANEQAIKQANTYSYSKQTSKL